MLVIFTMVEDTAQFPEVRLSGLVSAGTVACLLRTLHLEDRDVEVEATGLVVLELLDPVHTGMKGELCPVLDSLCSDCVVSTIDPLRLLISLDPQEAHCNTVRPSAPVLAFANRFPSPLVRKSESRSSRNTHVSLSGQADLEFVS